MEGILRIGVDTGGTFTDVVLWPPEGGQPVVHKLLSTRENPGWAVVRGVAVVITQWAHASGLPAQIPLVVHGSTVATNALLEGKLARTAYVTTEGFEDVPWIGRQTRLGLYDLEPRKHTVPLDRECAIGVAERIDCSGKVLKPLADSELERVAQVLHELEVESVALSLLHSYANPAHERQLAKHLRRVLPTLHLTVSSELLPEFREYERASTAIINAMVGPVMAGYIGSLALDFGPGQLRIMASAGGSLPPEVVSREPVHTILSGPAGGVSGAFSAAKAAEQPRIITLDMGGTSTDVSLCDGGLTHSTEGEIAGLPVRLPMIAIHTVGAGGGSLAWQDAGGALRVGPESLGAEPGPACYGRQTTQAAVTDAHVVLGHLPVDAPLGSGLQLDQPAAEQAVGAVAERLGLGLVETALGILRVAEATMARAVQRISVEEGHDPREYLLMPFGGAGALHAARLAEHLGINRVLVPGNPGLLSALGMLGAAPLYNFSQAVMQLVEQSDGGYPELADLPAVVAALLQLTSRANEALDAEGIKPRDRTLAPALDLRYAGQSYEITVPLEPGSASAFETRHEELYGYRAQSMPLEVVAVRLRGSGIEQHLVLPMHPLRGKPLPEELGTRTEIQTAEGPQLARRLERADLMPGDELHGPALITEYSATTLIPQGWRLRVSSLLQLELTRETTDDA